MRDYEVGIVNMNVQAQAGQEQASKSAKKKYPNNPRGVQHGFMVVYPPLKGRRRKIKTFDRRWNRYKVAEQRERQRRIRRFTGQEHMVGPNEETDHGDGDA